MTITISNPSNPTQNLSAGQVALAPAPLLLALLLLLPRAAMAAAAAAAASVGADGAATAPPPMPMQTLGRSGLVVSRLSFGSWVTFSFQVGENDAYTLMKAAFARGVNLFDNAEAYARGAAESIMGAAIQRGIDEKVWRREDLVITTKLFFGAAPGAGASVNAKFLSRKHIVEGAAASLARLNLAYVDVIYAHRPDPVTPIEETVRAFNHLLDTGKAFYWGTSEWSAAQIAEAVGVADRLGLVRPLVEQPEYNIFARTRVEAEYAPLYDSMGLGLTTWSPLASGVLTGKYSGRKLPEGSRLTVPNYKFLLDAKACLLHTESATAPPTSNRHNLTPALPRVNQLRPPHPPIHPPTHPPTHPTPPLHNNSSERTHGRSTRRTSSRRSRRSSAARRRSSPSRGRSRTRTSRPSSSAPRRSRSSRRTSTRCACWTASRRRSWSASRPSARGGAARRGTRARCRATASAARRRWRTGWARRASLGSNFKL